MAFAKISEKKVNQILELGKLEDLSTKEIAKEVGVSTGTVSRYLSRATRKRPEAEGSFEKVLALLEETLTLQKEQSRPKFPFCPRCGYLMFYYFARSEMACPNCGYYFEIDEPQWQRGEAIKI